ncbi:hypothetical protein [Paenibacillus sedimenti]|uniref:Uncharacterized protein n=1 Tax=Paenibacillus sedimenti TaxID=2770274 RepID=A0A926QIA8_9BACL|nr:hypothetical protein [Paenibacillus sedimenti]MBD0379359.1 hypothetical protein [Paenibacillus sedimenti]
MLQRSPKDDTGDFLFHFSSIKIYNEHTLVAAPMGSGVYVRHKEGDWEGLRQGMPEDVHVNRLIIQTGKLFACTNKGLFEFDMICELWRDTGLVIGCYQLREAGGQLWAATPYGLWSRTGTGWHKIAYSHVRVYDFLFYPEFIILALEFGIAVYDRLVGVWMEFPFNEAVTGLAVFEGHILGVTENGTLLHGDKQGGFEQIRFPHLFLFSIVTKGSEVYACSDRGLFRISCIRDQITLISVRLGCPVTDIDCNADNLYMATLFQGIQRLEL